MTTAAEHVDLRHMQGVLLQTVAEHLSWRDRAAFACSCRGVHVAVQPLVEKSRDAVVLRLVRRWRLRALTPEPGRFTTSYRGAADAVVDEYLSRTRDRHMLVCLIWMAGSPLRKPVRDDLDAQLYYMTRRAFLAAGLWPHLRGAPTCRRYWELLEDWSPDRSRSAVATLYKRLCIPHAAAAGAQFFKIRHHSSVELFVRLLS